MCEETFQQPAKQSNRRLNNKAGQANQEAEIEILCVKHTLPAGGQRWVKLGAKGNRWFEMNMDTAVDCYKNTLQRSEAIVSTFKKILVAFTKTLRFAERNTNVLMGNIRTVNMKLLAISKHLFQTGYHFVTG